MVVVRYKVKGTTFEVDDREYKLQYAVGSGAYGTVCSAVDVRTNERVAIKKVTNAFVEVDTRRILREIKLLKHFKHENIISLKDILRPPSYEEFRDIYLISELMDTDLHQIIKSDQELTDKHVQYLMYGILRGLKCIHSANVLHRDIKPSNILLNSNCDLKICDFGLARGEEDAKDMTDYVATRWYRAPELLMQWTKYDKAIDIWSVGCIFAELIGRKPLFPGRNYIDQLHVILDIIGTPHPREYEGMGSEHARRYLSNLPHRPKIPFTQLYPNANALAINMIEKMLRFNPNDRPTVEQCLADPYFERLHDEADEPVAEHLFDNSFEKHIKQPADMKLMIYQEMLQFHPDPPAFQQQVSAAAPSMLQAGTPSQGSSASEIIDEGGELGDIPPSPSPFSAREDLMEF